MQGPDVQGEDILRQGGWSICCGVAVWGWRFLSQGGLWYEAAAGRMSPSGMQGGKLQFCGGRTPVYTSCHLSAKGKSSIAYQVVLFLY